jgi:hypothetical protein
MPTAFVSEWKFDGPTAAGSPAVAADLKDTWSANDGMPSTTAPTIREGKDCVSGKCLEFNGSSNYVSVPDSDSLDTIFGTEKFTFDLWIRPKYLNVDYQGIINKRSNNYYSASPAGLFVNNRNWIYFLIGTGNPAETADALSYSIVSYFEKWIHVAAVAGNGKMRLYVNGKLGAERNIALNPPINNEPMTIGGFQMNSRSFSGRIDELKIYKDVLTLSQIQNSYYAGLDSLYDNGVITAEEYQIRKGFCLADSN